MFGGGFIGSQESVPYLRRALQGDQRYPQDLHNDIRYEMPVSYLISFSEAIKALGTRLEFLDGELARLVGSVKCHGSVLGCREVGADQQQIMAGLCGANGQLPHRPKRPQRSHLKIIGEDEPGKP